MSIPPTATFKEAMIAEGKVLKAELRREGTTRVSLETFVSALANRTKAHHCRRGAPCGTNAQWLFHEVAKEVYAAI